MDFDVLAAYDQWRAAPDVTLFSASGAGGRWWRLATLDGFDGVAWAPAGAFRRVGKHVEPPNAPPRRDATVETTVRIVELDGPFLPSIDRATEVHGIDAWMDADSGTLVRDPDEAEQQETYAVASSVARPVGHGATLVHPAGGDPDDEGLRYVPPECAATAAAVLDTVEPPPPAGSDATRVRRWAGSLSQAVAGRLTPVPAGDTAGTPVGSADGNRYGCASLHEIVSTGGAATQGQAVAVFVVAARHAGLPARVVVGFAPTDDVIDASSKRAVSGKHARLWAEVYAPEQGWMPFFVGSSDPVERAVTAVSGGSSGPGAGGGRGGLKEDQQVGDAPPGVEDPVLDTAFQVARIVLRVLLVLLLLLVIVSILIAAGRAVRRRMSARRAACARAELRRRGSPAEQVEAAWYDAVDDVAASKGAVVAAGSTADDVVTQARRVRPRAAVEELRVLRVAAGRVIYGGIDALTDEEVDDAWRRRDSFVRSARRTPDRTARRTSISREPVGGAERM